MNFVTDINDPKKEEILALLDYVKKAVNDGLYVVLKRQENLDFIFDYGLTLEIIVPEVIETLTTDDFCECAISDNDEHSGIIYIFRSEKDLTEVGDDYTELVEIYIKFSCEDGDGLIFISFHDAKFDMHAYKWR